MQCFQHPQDAAVALCTRCDQLLCGACLHERNSKKFCAKCAQFLDRRTAQRTTGSIPVQPPGASPPAAPPVAAAPPPAVTTAPPVAAAPPPVAAAPPPTVTTAPPVAAAPPPPPPPGPTPRAAAPVAPAQSPAPSGAQRAVSRPAPLAPTPSEELYFGTSAVAPPVAAPPVVARPAAPQAAALQPAAPQPAPSATDDLFFGTPTAPANPAPASVPPAETSWDDDLLALKEDFAVPAQAASPPVPTPAVVPPTPSLPQSAAASPGAPQQGAPQPSAPYLGPPISQLKSGAAEPSWMQNDGIIPIKEDDPPPPPAAGDGVFQGGDDLFLGDPPAASTAGGGDVYPGDVYQGESPQGDVYQGAVYQGDVYQGESAATGAMAAATVEATAGVPLRGLIVAIFAGTMAATAWYWLSVTTGWQLSLVSWLIGLGVGVAAVAGTGRNGMDAAVIAASITGFALLMGEFQIAKYFDRQYEQVYELAETIERDGDYTDAEVATLMGMTQSDFEALSNSEQQMIRVIAQLGDEEYDEDYYGDGEGISEVEDYDTGWEPLTFGYFLGNFRDYLGFKGIIIWLVGVGAAFRLGLGNTD